MGALQELGGNLRRHAAGNARHRRQQGQFSGRVGDGLVGKRRNARRHEVVGLRGIGSQMQIGEDDLASAQLPPFGCKRFLHLHDQFGALKYLIRTCHDFGTSGHVLLIGNAGACTCGRLDRNAMPPRRQFLDGCRSEADAVFVGFDFSGNADEHGYLATGDAPRERQRRCRERG